MKTENLQILINAVDKTGGAFKSVEGKMGSCRKSFDRIGEAMKSTGQGMQNAGKAINKVAIPAFLAMTGAGIKVSKMSWDQVSAVEQATVAFRAYEKDGKKVDAVLNDLLAYARSDMGVLFNRTELFSAAQGLKIMGDNTEDLVDHVKIMSRSVGLGLSTWDDLNRIVGRVGSTGRLTGDDFDNLTKAGYRLDDSIRNTDITWEELFKHLDKGIPADAMEGQADTIVGLRLQTAFRGIGDAILGVDSDTGKFIKGGAGDQLKQFLADLAEAFKGDEAKRGFEKLGNSVADFAKKALPKIIDFISFISEHSDTILKLGVELIGLGTGLSVAGKGLEILSAFANPFGLVVLGFVTLAGLFAKGFIDDCGGVEQAFTKIKDSGLEPVLNKFANIMAEKVVPAIVKIINKIDHWISKNPELFSTLGALIPVVLTLIGGIITIMGVVAKVIGIFMKFKWIIGVVKAVLGVFSGTVGIVIGLLAVIGVAVFTIVKNWSGAFDTLKALWGVLVAKIRTRINETKLFFRNLGSTVSSIFSNIKSSVSNAINAIVSFFKGLPSRVYNALRGFASKVANFLRIKFPKIKLPHFEVSFAKAGGIAGKALEKLGLPGKPVIGVKWYQEGGIFNKPSIIGVGEKGPEAVVPLNKAGGVGTTINITFTGNHFYSPEEIADKIDDVLMKKLKRNFKVVPQF